MKFTEEQLKQYAAPLSATEDQHCKNAIGMVRDALKEFGFTDNNNAISKLYEDTYAYSIEMRSLYGDRKIKIFIQGSYANNTNVRTQSDVDIAIVQEETFQATYRPGITDACYGFVTASTPAKTFKDEVQECLEKRFGNDVERKNKSIKVHGNTYRKDADTVPCKRYRDYSQDYSNNVDNFIGGITIVADDGSRVINYPEQHILNGKKKNSETNTYYKKMVRIIKKLRYLMEDKYIINVGEMSSFGLESLLWNVPSDIFKKYNPVYRYTFDEIVKYLFAHKNEITYFKEANGIKYLCPTQSDTSKYIAFVNKLSAFYEYDV